MDDETRARFDAMDARLSCLLDAMAIIRADFYNTKEFLLREISANARRINGISERLDRLEKDAP